MKTKMEKQNKDAVIYLCEKHKIYTPLRRDAIIKDEQCAMLDCSAYATSVGIILLERADSEDGQEI